MTNKERKTKIEQYAAGPARLREALAKVPAEALQWRPAPGKWSAHEVVVHCGDSETNAAIRIRYLLAEKSPLIAGYDQDQWVGTLDYHSLPLGPALAAVEAARDNTIPLIQRIPDDWWLREGTHSERGRYSAENWLETYADHLEVHARQIERNVAAFLAAKA